MVFQIRVARDGSAVIEPSPGAPEHTGISLRKAQERAEALAEVLRRLCRRSESGLARAATDLGVTIPD
ncbi:MAG: hypothetical protein PHU25_18025 [Deltaproteobacteria bacterium]|nr:hypothetical protein [Deltaproteobacteria bacterium]